MVFGSYIFVEGLMAGGNEQVKARGRQPSFWLPNVQSNQFILIRTATSCITSKQFSLNQRIAVQLQSDP